MAVPDQQRLNSAERATRRRRWLVGAICIMTLGCAAILVGNWLFNKETKASKPQLPDLADLNDDPEDPNIDHNPGYLGPAACSECHAKRVAEFQRTPHALACRRPQDAPMPNAFDGTRGQYTTADADLQFRMTSENGGFFQTAIMKTAGGERRFTSRIDLAYGANKADEVYFTWRGDKLYEHMVVWLHPTNQWANTSYNRYGTGESVRDATARCLECHNTWFDHVPGTTNTYKKDSFILGVTCERCHGPGKEHVDFHRKTPTAKEAHSIVHPGLLSREQQIEVCTQCHGNWIKHRGRTLSHRPGQPLEKSYRLATARFPEEDHVANQIKYLRQSKCFQKSPSMTCVTCHDPHRPHDKSDMLVATQSSCIHCHKPEACTDRPNLPVAVQDNCVACHMRQDVWTNVHFHTSTDHYLPPIRRFQHRIGIDPVARSEVLLHWHRTQTGDESKRKYEQLNTELVEHWLKEVAKRQKAYRFLPAIGAAREALILEPVPAIREKVASTLKDAIAITKRIDNDLVEALHQQEIKRPANAVEIFNRILSTKPDFAPVHSKLGTYYAASGQTQLAIDHLHQVAQHDPDDASGFAMLGWLAYLDNRPNDAAEYYRQAELIEPYDAKINYHWGLALIKLEKWQEARARFQKAITIDPNHAGASQGLAHALRSMGRSDEAVRFAWRAARLTDFAEIDILVTLAETYAEVNRLPEAAAAATKAFDVERNGGSKLAFDVRIRLNKILSTAGH